MKALSRTLMLLLMLVALVAFGCGDDDDDASTDTIGGDDTVVATGACQNDADLAQYVAHTDPDVATIAGVCGNACFADPQGMTLAECSDACIIRDAGLTTGCAACNTASIVCTAEKCMADCMADSSAQICTDCRVAEGCVSDFFACSGFSPDPVE